LTRAPAALSILPARLLHLFFAGNQQAATIAVRASKAPASHGLDWAENAYHVDAKLSRIRC